VAVNRFAADTDAELEAIAAYCGGKGARFALSEGFAKGGEGMRTLAEKVVAACGEPSRLEFMYPLSDTIEQKVGALAAKIYAADGVEYSAAARRQMAEIAKLGRDGLPVCVAKTQYSLSDNPALLGRPTGFTISVREVRLCAGAGFIVVYTGDIMTMPGLPGTPSACSIDIDGDGKITGLF